MPRIAHFCLQPSAALVKREAGSDPSCPRVARLGVRGALPHKKPHGSGQLEEAFSFIAGPYIRWAALPGPTRSGRPRITRGHEKLAFVNPSLMLQCPNRTRSHLIERTQHKHYKPEGKKRERRRGEEETVPFAGAGWFGSIWAAPHAAERDQHGDEASTLLRRRDDRR
jgi:hypothetical protein